MRTTIKAITSVCLALLATGAIGQVQNARRRPVADNPMYYKNHRVMGVSHDTVVTPPFSSMDSLQVIAVPMNSIPIPNTARHGWNFGVNITVKGSKADTVGLFYWSSGLVCGSFGVTNAYTEVGEHISPEVRNANSFVTGLTWFNDANNHGNGSPLTWPTTTGGNAGYCVNSGGKKFYDTLYAVCTDTSYFPVQDLGLAASISYNGGSHALIDYRIADRTISNNAPYFFYWVPGLYMNSNFVLADSGAPIQYLNPILPTSATVTFDTLWDSYTQGYVTPITPGSVTVDTIWLFMEYVNTSNTPDTVILEVRSVDSLGFPHRAIGNKHGAYVVYGRDTLVLKPKGLLAVPGISKEALSVKQNYPNPFNKATQINYTLIKQADVTFSVSDITGRVLINNVYSNTSPGEHTINLNANSLSPGVYFYTVMVDGFKVTKNMVITGN